MRLRHHLEYAGLMAVALTMRALPRPLALLVGAAIGQLGWWLRIRRRLVLDNLAQALGQAPRRELRRIAARAARNFGRTTCEMVRVEGADRRRLGELVEFSGLELLREALGRGDGAIVVTCHLGAWALYVAALSATGFPGALLVGKQHNPKVHAFLLAIPGPLVRMISKGRTSPREILLSLREGRVVMIVADQTSGSRGDFVPFLGRVASTLPLPAALALKHQTPLLLLAGHRVAGGRHRVTLSPLELPAVEGDAETCRYAATAAINEALGKAILEHPEQYFWYHRRWREYRGRVAADSRQPTANSSPTHPPKRHECGGVIDIAASLPRGQGWVGSRRGRGFLLLTRGGGKFRLWAVGCELLASPR
ncbi:MAG: lysophospholipid acyltransferase family protein, partial [Acidobacteriota bacterium]